MPHGRTHWRFRLRLRRIAPLMSLTDRPRRGSGPALIAMLGKYQWGVADATWQSPTRSVSRAWNVTSTGRTDEFRRDERLINSKGVKALVERSERSIYRDDAAG